MPGPTPGHFAFDVASFGLLWGHRPLRHRTIAIDPFFKRPRTPDEWRARARIIQSRLEGLTIDELLRASTSTAGQSAAVDAADTTPISRASLRAILTAGSGRTSRAAAPSTIRACCQTRRLTTFGSLAQIMRLSDITIHRGKYSAGLICGLRRYESLIKQCLGRLELRYVIRLRDKPIGTNMIRSTETTTEPSENYSRCISKAFAPVVSLRSS